MTHEHMQKFITDHVDELNEFMSSYQKCFGLCPVREICRKYGTSFWGMMNNQASEDEIRQLKESGCYMAYFNILQREWGVEDDKP